MSRKASIARTTTETTIQLDLNLDGTGHINCDTGIGFFDHMLTLMTQHGFLDLELKVKGDLDVDYHHTVEDVGICLGQAIKQSLGDCKGINRYASLAIPMDEALCSMALDISNRPYLAWDVELPKTKVGTFDVELAEEFFRSLVLNAGFTLHVNVTGGRNLHHVIESMFKALGRIIDSATQKDPRQTGVPSTKGALL